MNRMKENKAAYSKPSIELITMAPEGILCSSGTDGGTINGYKPGNVYSSRGKNKTTINGFSNGNTYSR